jgi:hypothetical protein
VPAVRRPGEQGRGVCCVGGRAGGGGGYRAAVVVGKGVGVSTSWAESSSTPCTVVCATHIRGMYACCGQLGHAAVLQHGSTCCSPVL